MAIPIPTVDDFQESTVMQECRAIVDYIINTLVPAINEGGSSYVLPPATKSTLGGIIVGDNLTVDGSGKVNAPTPYTLPIGGTNIGGVKNGGNVTINSDGTMNAKGGSTYVLPPATTTTLGGVIIGENISVDASGKISISNTGKNIVQYGDVYKLSDLFNAYEDYIEPKKEFIFEAIIADSPTIVTRVYVPKIKYSVNRNNTRFGIDGGNGFTGIEYNKDGDNFYVTPIVGDYDTPDVLNDYNNPSSGRYFRIYQ